MLLTSDNLVDVYKAKKSSVSTMELKGYTYIENLFIDSSGWGSPSEPALTGPQLENELRRIIAEHGPVTVKITSAGQFQVNMGVFKKTSKSRAVKIANNTYKITTDEGYIIRLHDTDILTFKGDTITLNSGGYQTVTTARRMNEYLPGGWRVFQKAWTWYIEDAKNKVIVPFKDGITVVNN